MSDTAFITPYPYPDAVTLVSREFVAADLGALADLSDEFEVVTGNPQIQLISGYYRAINVDDEIATDHAISRWLTPGHLEDPWRADIVADYPLSGLCFALQPNGDCHVVFSRTSPSRELVIGQYVSGVYTELTTLVVAHETKVANFIHQVEYDGGGLYRVWETSSNATDIQAPAGHIGLYHHAFGSGTTATLRGIEGVVFAGDPLTALPENSGLLLDLGREFTQEEWGSEWELHKTTHARTDDGVIHFITYGDPTLGGDYLAHHRSYDNGASFVSETFADVSGYVIRSLQVMTDGNRLMLLYRAGTSYTSVYQIVWESGTWGEPEDTGLDAYAVNSAYWQGEWHLLLDAKERYVYDEADGWEWQETIPTYDEGELGLTTQRRSGAIVAFGDKLAFGYLAAQSATSSFGRYCVQFFNGTSWSTPEILDSMTVTSDWSGVGWEHEPGSAVALHASYDQRRLHAAWVFGPEWSLVDEDYRQTLEIREHDGTEWLPSTLRRWTTLLDMGYLDGILLTPSLASDRKGDVYCFVGGYSPTFGNGVFYTVQPAGGSWSESYGHAAVDADSYVIYQPHAAHTVYLSSGVLFDVYQNVPEYGNGQDGTLLFRLPAVAVTPDPLPDIHHLWVFNTQERLRCVYSNFNIESCPYFDDLHIERLDGFESYEFSIPTEHPDAVYAEPEGFVAFPDLDRKLRMYRIKSVADQVTPEAARIRRIACEPVVLELLESVVRPVTFTSEWPQDILADLIAGTRWSVGDVDYAPLTTHEWKDYRSSWSAIVELAASTGLLIRPWVSISGNVVTGRYIDLLSDPQNVQGKFLDYTKDMAAITRTQHSPAIYTALIGLGRSKSDGSFVTFTDVVWTTPTNPVAKPADQDWVGDDDARELYGLINETGQNYHRWGVYQLPDETSASSLLEKTWEALQQVNRPRFSYEVSVVALERIREQRPGAGRYEHEKMRLGDVVAVRDFTITPPIVATETVVETMRSYTDPSRDMVTLGMARNKLTSTLADLKELQKRVYDSEGIWSGWTGS